MVNRVHDNSRDKNETEISERLYCCRLAAAVNEIKTKQADILITDGRKINIAKLQKYSDEP